MLGPAAAFAAVTAPSVVLDRHLIVRGANPACLAAVGRTWEDLAGQHLFTAFPSNPDAPDGGAALEACLRHVLSGSGVERLPLLRYDLALPRAPGRFAERYWSVVGSPMPCGGDEPAGVLLQAQDVTAVHHHLAGVLEALRDPDEESADDDAPVGTAPAAGVSALLDGAHRMQQVQQENAQLRRALESRAAIDQAIGIALAEHTGTPEEAFRRLVTLSQESNVKLRDVARALVARAAGPDRPLLP
ncbi:ANTAR domain-containing protein [Streptomyces sp. TR06-5]|uniref:ANTAR domain-containing protein n=1 Tax=Streptomyces sp. TR06-5 TaxID=3385976 RepID=UPI0039A32516